MRRLSLLLPLFLLAACQVEPDDAALGTAEDTARTVTAPVAARAPEPAAGGACLLTVATPGDTLTLYRRPSTEADVFGTLAPGDTAQIGGRTSDGWLGFDPGVAQAGNFGVFRLRWVAPGGPFRTVGDCDAVPEVDKLPPHACFTMAPQSTPVYARADTTAPVLDSLALNGYAEVTSVGTADWVRVRLDAGRFGWVAPRDVNFNGACTGLGG